MSGPLRGNFFDSHCTLSLQFQGLKQVRSRFQIRLACF